MRSPGDVRDLIHELQVLDVTQPVGGWIGERLRTALGVEIGGTYRLSEGAQGIEVSHFSFASTTPGEGDEFRRGFIEWCRRRGALWGTYDPRCVDRAQRNRAVLTPPISAVVSEEAVDEFFKPLDITGPQVRALLCDGPRLIAWVGCVLRRRPPPHALGAFRAVLPAIRARFLVERRLEEAAVTGAAFPAALDAITVPAFLVELGRRVLHANRIGQRWIDRAPHAARTALLARSGPDPAQFEVNRLAGVDRYALATLRAPPDDIAARVAVATRRWRLTRREADVLQWLASGASNARIAAELGCADRTVEIHVGRLLAKAEAESRGEVISRVWSGADRER